MKTCVIVPAYNEIAAIGAVVEKLIKRGLDVVVIDDGSEDGSGELARRNGAHVIRHDEKMGKGKALRHGFEYALKQNYDQVVTLDGDGQHDVDDIDQFLKKSLESPKSIVTGTRLGSPEGMPWLRLLTNRIMSGFISLACHQSIPDTQCGYRLISCDILRAISISSSDFEIETEVLIKAAKKGFRIHSVPIRTIYRNEASKINPLLDTVRFVVYFIKEMCNKSS